MSHPPSPDPAQPPIPPEMPLTPEPPDIPIQPIPEPDTEAPRLPN